MARGRTFQRQFQRTAVRQTSWSNGPGGTSGSLSAAGSALFASGSQALVDGLTLVRTRGRVTIWLTSIDAALSGFRQVAVGLCKVTENAFNAGVASVPTPITDIGWDGWIWHSQTQSMICPSATLVNGLGANLLQIDIDSKAMRKFDITDVNAAVIEVSGETGTAVITAELRTRVLDKIA